MTAALTAARLGHEVTLYERQTRVGRKLMATGNGRCNLTNLNAAPERYHGDVPFMERARAVELPRRGPGLRPSRARGLPERGGA